MNVYDFLKKLNSIFPLQDSDDNFTLRINKYAELLNKTEAKANKFIDYEKLFDLMIENYPYRSFPNYTEISKYLVYEEPETKSRNTVWEYKNYIVTTESGYEYEFVSVPPSWDCEHTLKDFPKYREVD